MLVRAFCLFAAVFYLSAASAAECNYSEQGSFLSRVVAIESAGGPIYRPVKDAKGATDTPSPLELRDKEVLLVFNQGPNPAYTRYILEDLDHRCAKAVFFFAGNAAMANPDSVKDVARRGHTIAAGPGPRLPTSRRCPVKAHKPRSRRASQASPRHRAVRSRPSSAHPARPFRQPPSITSRNGALACGPRT